MAPSPQDHLQPHAVRNYDDSWRAIMHLVRSGYSWSGHERNCVFLNVTQADGTQVVVPRFANASAVSGLDLTDDGRSVAVVDWDQDGDLDLWFRNRSAPRLRLMRNRMNEIAPDDRRIEIRLIGTTCNRDAIGARVELVLKTPDPRGRRVVRSVRAGDAFLSQSSKWLHFGIEKDAVVAQLTVVWPGGDKEQFLGFAAGSSYEIKQGAGTAIPLKQRRPVSLAADPYEPLKATGAARIVLPGRVALPPLSLRFDDSPDLLEYEGNQTPTLISFWTSSCANCRQELTDMAKHASEFLQANLDVLAICLDGLDSSDGALPEDTNDAQKFLQKIEFPFQAARTNRETIEVIRDFQNVLFSKYPGFVVPLSFLVDSDGQIVSIYRGAFSYETLLQDRGLIDLDDKALRTVTTPFVGTWITKPATRSQFAEFVGSRLMTRKPKAALRYYETAIATENDVNRQTSLREKIKRLRLSIEGNTGK